MERLLEDAEKISGIKYDISSYADIVDAIHVVQTEMGITGTTAKEASTTIEGSLNSVKASWENLVVGFANDGADMNELISQFTESVGTLADNVLPRVKVAVSSIANNLGNLGGSLVGSFFGEEVGSNVKNTIDTIMSAVTKVFGMFERFTPVINTAFGLINNLVSSVMPPILSIIGQIAGRLQPLINLVENVANVVIPALTTGLNIVAVAIGPIMDMIGGIADGISGLLSPIGALFGWLADITTVHDMNEEMREFNKTLKDASDNTDTLVDSFNSSVSSIDEEYKKYNDLTDKLGEYVDENGKVKEGKEEQAKVILNELNPLLGTESEIVDGQVTNYKDLTEAIQKTVVVKQLQAQIDARENSQIYKDAQDTEKYTEAMNNYNQALDTKKQKEREYNEVHSMVTKAERDYKEAVEAAKGAVNSGYGQTLISDREHAKEVLEQLTVKEREYKGYLDEATAGMLDAENVIGRYNEALGEQQASIDAINSGSMQDMKKAIEDNSNTLLNETQASEEYLHRQVTDLESSYEEKMGLWKKTGQQQFKTQADADKKTLAEANKYYTNSVNITKNKKQQEANVLRDTMNKQHNLLKSGFKSQESTVKNAMSTENSLLKQGWSVMNSSTSSGLSKVNSTAKSGLNTLKNQGSGASAWWINIGPSLWSGFTSSFNSSYSTAYSNVSNKLSSINSLAKKIFKINSPSKTFMSIGSGIVEGLDLGFSREIPKTHKKISDHLSFTADLSGGFANRNNSLEKSINELNSNIRKLTKQDNSRYTVNGLTYSDGNVNKALKQLARSMTIGGRI